MKAIVSDNKQGAPAMSSTHTYHGTQSYLRPLYPNRALPLTDHPPVVLLAMCLFGEARGEADETRRAVAQVIVNRARHPHRVFGSRRGLMFHENVIRVITQPCQFSCLLTNDVNYAKLFDPVSHDGKGVWDSCMALASEALLSDELPDTLTYNSDHYFDDSIQPPSWADPAKATVTIGPLRFYRLYLPAPHTSSGKAEPQGESRVAPRLPSPSTTLSVASTAADKAFPMSFPAPAPSILGKFRIGSTGRPRGWELTSLGAQPGTLSPGADAASKGEDA